MRQWGMGEGGIRSAGSWMGPQSDSTIDVRSRSAATRARRTLGGFRWATLLGVTRRYAGC